MNTQKPSKRKQRSCWIIGILLVIATVVIEPFYREPLFKVSIQFIESIQGESPKGNPFLIMSNCLSFLGSNYAFVFWVVIVYNFLNIYKTLILLVVLMLSQLLTGTFKLIYLHPRPFMTDEKILPFGCQGGWGQPSGHAMTSTAFYLTLWSVIFNCVQLNKKKTGKYVTLLVTILLILLIMFTRIATGNHSLNQVLYGGLIGFLIYFFVFFVLCIRVNDATQLLYLIEFRFLIICLINAFIVTFTLILYFFNTKQVDVNIYTEIIQRQCADQLPSKNKMFQEEALITFCTFLANIGMILGLKCEYFYLFSENNVNWSQFNFEVDEKRDDESLMTKIAINKETQWNHTKSFQAFLRLFVILTLSVLMMIPHFFVIWDDNLALVLLVKLILPLNLITFGMFIGFKQVLKCLKLLNMTLFTMLRESD